MQINKKILAISLCCISIAALYLYKNAASLWHDVLRNKVYLHAERGNQQALIASLHELLESSETSDRERAKTLTILANAYAESEDAPGYAAALHYYNAALAIPELPERHRAETYFTVAQIYFNGDSDIDRDWQTALSYYQAALAMPKLPDIYRAAALSGIAAIYFHGQSGVELDWHYALNYYHKALAMPALPDSMRAEALSHMGSIYTDNLGISPDLERAIHYYEAALAAPALTDEMRVTALLRMGALYFGENGLDADWQKVFDYYQEALALAMALGNNEIIEILKPKMDTLRLLALESEFQSMLLESDTEQNCPDLIE